MSAAHEQEGPRPFELVYHGQYDDSRPGNDIPVTGRWVLYHLRL